MMNLRRQYRTFSPSTCDIEVELIQSGNKRHHGKVYDLSFGGIGVYFPQNRDPLCALREPVSLKIAARGLGKALVVPSIVRRCDEVLNGRVYGLEFVDIQNLLAQLPQALADLFNRRSVCRVEMDPNTPILVNLEIDGTKITGMMHDISAVGISVSILSKKERRLKRVRAIQISFNLPCDSEAIHFKGIIQHRTVTAEGIRYGIAFDSENTQNFWLKQESLKRFIHERWIQILGLSEAEAEEEVPRKPPSRKRAPQRA